MGNKKILVFDDDENKLSLMLGDTSRVSSLKEVEPGVRYFFDSNGELIVIEIQNPRQNLEIIPEIYCQNFISSKYYVLNRLLTILGLHGIGILNFENDQVSGENYFLQWLAQKFPKPFPVILDIGANVGNYSSLIRKKIPTAKIFAFEPHPVSFEKLQTMAMQHHFVAVNKGCGKEEGSFELFDYEDLQGSSHASKYRESIETLRDSDVKPVSVQQTTVDQIVKEFNLEHILLLKIDTEGMELDVLRGASNLIKNHKVDVIQFEFNEMNVFSRSFFSDFEKILPGYKFYRLLPDGLAEMGSQTFWRELFAFQNIIAIEENLL